MQNPASRYDTCLLTLEGQLVACPEIRIERLDRRACTSTERRLRGLPLSVQHFYRHSDGLVVRWTTANRSRGSILVVGLAEAMSSWQDVVWFDWSPPDDPMRRFRVIDWISPTTFVGVFDGQPEDELFYFDGEDVVPLRLDMDGYLAMALFCRGLFGWHEAAVAVLDGRGAAAAGIFDASVSPALRGFSAQDFERAFATLRKEARPRTARSFTPFAA